jgi:hypothetical protein
MKIGVANCRNKGGGEADIAAPMSLSLLRGRVAAACGAIGNTRLNFIHRRSGFPEYLCKHYNNLEDKRLGAGYGNACL